MKKVDCKNIKQPYEANNKWKIRKHMPSILIP